MINQKVNRGYVEGEKEIKPFYDLRKEQLIELFESDVATDRTIAIRCLHKGKLFTKEDIKYLCESLMNEKKLYVRLEIEKVLTDIGAENLPVLISYLSLIGNNRHLSRGKTSLKKSYPLPRDIIARIIGHFDLENVNVDTLYEMMFTLERNQLSEMIDGIGFLTFYNPSLSTEVYFNRMKLFVRSKYLGDDLIMWKFYMYCSAFSKIKECREFLQGGTHQNRWRFRDRSFSSIPLG